MDTFVIAEYAHGLRVAHLRDGVLLNLAFEPFLKGKQANLDDIVSARVLAKRQDFIWLDAGLDRECVIKTQSFYNKIPPEGSYVWAQVVRLPWPEASVYTSHDKGYRLSTRITVVGKYWVYTPTSWDPHRWKLRSRVEKEFDLEHQNQPFDTVELLSPDCSVEKSFFEQSYHRLTLSPNHVGFFKRALNQWQRWVRDAQMPFQILCDTQNVLSIVRSWLLQYDASLVDCAKAATLHESPLFRYFDLDDIWHECLHPVVVLDNGIRMDIRECAAATLIDINAGSNLNDALAINLSCLKNLKQHVLWRNLSGNILVDFLRLTRTKEKKLTDAVQEIFKDTDIKVMGFCNLGLMQLQRKRMRPSMMASLLHRCNQCHGDGWIKK